METHTHTQTYTHYHLFIFRLGEQTCVIHISNLFSTSQIAANLVASNHIDSLIVLLFILLINFLCKNNCVTVKSGIGFLGMEEI